MGRSRKRRAELEPSSKEPMVRFRDPRSRSIAVALIPGTIAGGVIGAWAAGAVGAIALAYFVVIGCALAITKLEKARR